MAKVLLTVVILLTLTTATIHSVFLGSSVAGFRGQGAFPGAAGRVPGNGQVQGNPGQQPGNARAGRGGGNFGLLAALPLPLALLFVLNGLGYLTLLALMVLPLPFFRDHPALTHGMLIGYALLTFVLYFVFNGTGRFLTNPLAITAKTAEVVLIITTFLHWRAVAHKTPAALPVTVASGEHA